MKRPFYSLKGLLYGFLCPSVYIWKYSRSMFWGGTEFKYFWNVKTIPVDHCVLSVSWLDPSIHTFPLASCQCSFGGKNGVSAQLYWVSAMSLNSAQARALPCLVIATAVQGPHISWRKHNPVSLPWASSHVFAIYYFCMHNHPSFVRLEPIARMVFINKAISYDSTWTWLVWVQLHPYIFRIIAFSHFV